MLRLMRKKSWYVFECVLSLGFFFLQTFDIILTPKSENRLGLNFMMLLMVCMPLLCILQYIIEMVLQWGLSNQIVWHNDVFTRVL